MLNGFESVGWTEASVAWETEVEVAGVFPLDFFVIIRTYVAMWYLVNFARYLPLWSYCDSLWRMICDTAV